MAKKRDARRAIKQAVKEKKGKKKELLHDRKGEEDWLIDSFVQRGGGNQFLAACALTNMLKMKEKKTQMKRGESNLVSDA